MSTSRGPARSLAGQAGRQLAYYEHARSYNGDTGAFQPYRRAVVEALPLPHGQVVLDVGCGTGLCCGLLREKVGPCGAVIGIEESPEMAAIAREYIAREGWHNVTVVQSPAEDARLEATADAALSSAPFTTSCNPPTRCGTSWRACLREHGWRLAEASGRHR